MGDQALVLRMAERSDAQAIHDLISQLAVFLGDDGKFVASAEDYAEHGFGDDPKFDCVLAELDGEPVGLCLYFQSFSTWFGKPGVYVQDLFVSDKARGLGLGKRLMAKVAQISAAKGCAYLRLSVDTDNQSAQDFYSGIGMAWSSSEKIYALRLDDFQSFAASCSD